ncbi:hypothetical protein [Collimonas fungivorans]|uniref:hypothetical protein n=1 Tax=Collimonas fungivorans TaxID=158899 RepID=UPI003FA3B4D6
MMHFSQSQSSSMKNIVLGLISVTLALPCFAQSVDAPSVKAGDSWTYRLTVEKGPSGWSQSRSEVVVSHVTSSSIYYSTKQSGSTQAANDLFAGTDWSRSRDVNGKETVINKPFSFPLSVGKTWEVQYTEQHPNKVHRFEQWSHKFTVVGFETIEVPAGKFKAIKIEEEGRWNAEMEPAQTILQGAQTGQGGATMVTQVQKTTAGPATGRTYKAFWYVPEVKRWVKSVEEYYGNGGVRTERYTGELESFKLSE